MDRSIAVEHWTEVAVVMLSRLENVRTDSGGVLTSFCPKKLQILLNNVCKRPTIVAKLNPPVSGYKCFP